MLPVPHTHGPCLAEVAGAVWLSLVPALSDWGQVPLAALFGESDPCWEVPAAPLSPPQEQKGCPSASWVSETAGVTSCAGPRPKEGGEMPPITALSGVVGCQAVEWIWRPRATHGGSEQESFGRQTRDKITVTWGQ